MEVLRLKELLDEANNNKGNLLLWRNNSSFSRWKEKVSRSLNRLFDEGNADLVSWKKRSFGPRVIFSTTTESAKDQIFIAATNQAINQLTDIIDDLEFNVQKENNEKPLRVKKVDITSHCFDVAFSFPGEVRDYVEKTANLLIEELGDNAVFYDNNFKAQLARPSLDTVLQNIYRNQAKLVVVYLCEKYQEKKWCSVEFRAIQESLFERELDKIMFVRMDQGKVEGVFNTDGFIDGSNHTPEDVAEFIQERLELQS